MEKISFFTDDLEDFDELMELSEEEDCLRAAPTVVLPPVEPAVKIDSVEKIASAVPVPLEAPPQLPVVSVETATETKSDTATKSSVATSSSLRYRCHVCGDKHPLRFCWKFLRLSLVKRLRVVVQYGYCSRCLAQSHRTKDCRSKGRCKKCDGDHHLLLHSGSTPALTGKKSDVRPSPSKSKMSRPSQSCNSGPSEKYRDPANLPPGANIVSAVSTLPLISVVSLSPSLVVHVKSTTSSIPVRAVLDPCGKQSQLCSALMKFLQLPISHLDGVPLCRFTIASAYDPKQTLTLTARVCSLEHVFTPPESVPERIQESYLGLPLADPQFYKRGRVALVLGPEVYAQIITSRVHTTPGLPVAQYTIFGWVLSGVCNA